MSKSVGVKKKSIWRDKTSWELLMLCVPTLLAFTLFHYEPPARIWSCSQPEVPSSIMRKFIYKSGRTQSAQGRETCP